MGLSDSVSHFVWLTVTVSVGFAVAMTTFVAVDEKAEAEQDVHERALALAGIAITGAIADYDIVEGTLMVGFWNTGTGHVRLSDLTVLVDGVARPGAVLTVTGAAGSDLWTPGSYLRIDVDGITTFPWRFTLATTSPSMTVVSFENIRALDAGLRFVAGPGSMKERYFSDFRLSPDSTVFSGVFKGRSGVETRVSHVVGLTNGGSAPVNVTLSGDQLSLSDLELFRWTVRNGTDVLGFVDYLSVSPSVSFTLPVGETYVLDMELDLKEGAGLLGLDSRFVLRLEVG